MQQGQTTYTSANPLTTWLVALLSFYLLVLLIGIVPGYLELELIRKIKFGFFDSQTDYLTMVTAAGESDSRQQIIGIFQLCVYLATAVVFLVWKNKSYKNLAALGSKGLEYSPGWAVGGYFVPILTLFRPFQVMREIWRASNPKSDINYTDNGMEWKNSPSSVILPLWWSLFLIDSFIGQRAFRLALSAKELDELYESSMITFVSDIISIPLTVVAIILVRAINKRQQSKFIEKQKFLASAYNPKTYSNYKQNDYKDLENYEEIDESLIEEKDKPRVYGAILGLHGSVTKQRIIDAYKALIAKYHPDKVSHLGIEFQRYAEKRTRDINKAFSYLKKRFNV